MWNARIEPNIGQNRSGMGTGNDLESDVVLSCNEEHINLYISEGQSALSGSSTGA